MGFKENLKAELTYTDMRVKELAKLSGVKKSTIDSYLSENGYTPSVEAATRISEVLGVSVEYLVRGKETKRRESHTSLDPDIRLLLKNLEQVNAEDRKIIVENALNLIDALIYRNEKNKAGSP